MSNYEKMPDCNGNMNLNRYTSEQARINGSKGGKKSAENKKRKKAMKETLEMFLNMSMKSGRSTDLENIKNLKDLKGKNISVQDAIILAQINKALKGDTTAFNAIRDTSGNKPSDKLEVKGEGQVIIVDDLTE